MTIIRPAAPRAFPITRKSGGKFVTDPMPGPHPKEECIPLSLLLRMSVKTTDSSREAKSIVKAGKISIDGRVRMNHKYPAGIFDSVVVGEDAYRIVPTHTGFKVIGIDRKEADIKLCKIKNKTLLKGGKTQLNMNDGKNIIVDKDVYKTGDSLLVSLPDLQVKKHIKKSEGCVCLVTRGKNRSKIGILSKTSIVRGTGSNTATVKLADKDIVVPEDAVFVLGDKSPEIAVE